MRAAPGRIVDCIRGAQGTARPTVAHRFMVFMRDNSFAIEPLHEPTLAGGARHSVRAAPGCIVDCIRGAQGTARPTVAQRFIVFTRDNCFAIKPLSLNRPLPVGRVTPCAPPLDASLTASAARMGLRALPLRIGSWSSRVTSPLPSSLFP